MFGITNIKFRRIGVAKWLKNGAFKYNACYMAFKIRYKKYGKLRIKKGVVNHGHNPLGVHG
jgi:hypothetical protein